MRPDASDGDDPVSEIADLRVLDMDLVDNFIEFSKPRADTAMTSIDRRSPAEQNRKRRVPLDLGVEFIQQRLDVSAVVRISGALGPLDVVLRHLPAVSRGQGRVPGETWTFIRPPRVTALELGVPLAEAREAMN